MVSTFVIQPTRSSGNSTVTGKELQFTTVVRHCFTLIFHCVYCRLQRVYSRIHTVKTYLDISINFPLLLYFTMGKAADPNVLYRVEVLERDNERVKVHWIGYSDDKDEWIPANSLTTLDSSQECKSGGVLHLEHYFPSISMAYRIKASLTAGTREDRTAF